MGQIFAKEFCVPYCSYSAIIFLLSHPRLPNADLSVANSQALSRNPPNASPNAEYRTPNPKENPSQHDMNWQQADQSYGKVQ
jgi:hypothetical protein